jgi:CheY-like chemotaxis protein
MEQQNTLVCVVDDDPLYRETICTMLEGTRYATVTADDGEVGLKQLEKSGARLLVIDMFMPCREGLETISEAKRRFNDIKVIAISSGGHTQVGDVLNWARELGADTCLAKPFRKAALLAALADVSAA